MNANTHDFSTHSIHEMGLIQDAVMSGDAARYEELTGHSWDERPDEWKGVDANAKLAAAVFISHGRDKLAAAAAWQKMGNDCSPTEFMQLVVRAL